MPKSQRNLEKREEIETTKEEIKLIAQTTKKKLVTVIGFLLASILILIFKTGAAFWSLWMLEHRTQAIGVVLLIVTLIILFSPIIIEANSNPQTLQGPGRNPKDGDFWTKE